MTNQRKENNDNWILLRSYSNLQEAEIDKGLLESNGIPCVLQNEAISSVYPMTDTWTPLNMLIPESFALEARELLHHP